MADMAIVFLHGAGGTGPRMQAHLNEIGFSDKLRPLRVRIECPTAVVRPYTLACGEPRCVWFDRQTYDLDGPEDLAGIESSFRQVNEVLDNLIKEGFSPENILIGGMSQGGAMALNTVARSQHALRGCFALSSFLYTSSQCLLLLRDMPRTPQIYMSHGRDDDLIPIGHGRATAAALQAAGCSVVWNEMAALQHDLTEDVASRAAQWILSIAPAQPRL